MTSVACNTFGLRFGPRHEVDFGFDGHSYFSTVEETIPSSRPRHNIYPKLYPRRPGTIRTTEIFRSCRYTRDAQQRTRIPRCNSQTKYAKKEIHLLHSLKGSRVPVESPTQQVNPSKKSRPPSESRMVTGRPYESSRIDQRMYMAHTGALSKVRGGRASLWQPSPQWRHRIHERCAQPTSQLPSMSPRR